MNQLLVWDNVLNYEKSIKKHNFNIMGGTSWTKSHYTNSWMRGSHYRNDDIQTLNAANQIAWGEDPNATTGTGASQWAIMSVFGRAFYNYDDRY